MDGEEIELTRGKPWGRYIAGPERRVGAKRGGPLNPGKCWVGDGGNGGEKTAGGPKWGGERSIKGQGAVWLPQKWWETPPGEQVGVDFLGPP